MFNEIKLKSDCNSFMYCQCIKFFFTSPKFHLCHQKKCLKCMFSTNVLIHILLCQVILISFILSLIHSFVYHFNFTDCCSSLLFGSTHDVTSHLQRIHNNAVRVILRLPKSSSITTHLKSLHWLPVKVRSTYKIACLCYHCHSSTAPSYVTDMLQKKSSHTRNTCSSSYTMPLLNRHAHCRATLSDRSFSLASTSVWNSFPNDVRCAPSLSSSKSLSLVSFSLQRLNFIFNNCTHMHGLALLLIC